VEVTNLKEVREAVAAAADIIMFDNMSPSQMRAAVKIVPASIKTEASGNITLKKVPAVAETAQFYLNRGIDAFLKSAGYQPGISNRFSRRKNKWPDSVNLLSQK